MCEGDDLCYKENTAIKNFLDQPMIRVMLGVETPNNFSACSPKVSRNENLHMEKWAVSAQHYVAHLLERGIRMLILPERTTGNAIRSQTNSGSTNWTGPERKHTVRRTGAFGFPVGRSLVRPRRRDT
ncbi:hypothetical protein AcV5_000576 [Taiwanofungus camphoratus]|nr:hypothetical protein AcV5_000576 [Antrodia cinnamomea]